MPRRSPLYAEKKIMSLENQSLKSMGVYMALGSIAIGFILAILSAEHFAPISSFYQQSATAISLWLAAVIILLSGALKGDWLLPWTWLTAALLALVIIAGVAIHPHSMADMMIWPIGALATAAMASWMGHALAQAERAQTLSAALMAAFAVSAVGTAVICWLQIFYPAYQTVWLFPRPVLSAPFGNLAQRNEAALVLAFGLLALGFFTRQGLPGLVWKRVLATGVAVLLLSAIALTQSRIGLAFTLTAGAVVGLMWAAPNKRLRGLAAGIVVFALGYLALQWLVYDAFGLGQLFPPGTQRLVDRGVGQRLGMLQVAWAEFSAHPFFGGGFGSFGGWEYKLALHNSAPLYSTNAHNLFAQIGAELGIVGLLALIVPAAISFTGIVRRLFASGISHWPAWQIASLGTLLMIAGYSMTEYPLWHTYFLIPTALLWGAMDSTAIRLKISRSIKIALGLVPILMIAFLGWAGIRYYEIAKLYDYVYGFKNYQTHREKFNTELSKLFFSPGFSLYTEALNFYGLSVDDFMLKDKITLGERVVLAMPNSYFITNLGMLYALNHQPTLAAQTFAKACALGPSQCEAIRHDVAHMAQLHPKRFEPTFQQFRALPQYGIQSKVANVLRPWDKNTDGTVVTIDPSKTLFGFDLALYASGLAQAGMRSGTFLAIPTNTAASASHASPNP